MKKGLTKKIDLLPVKPGVYLFKDISGQILYIGKANRLRQRVLSHFKTPRLRSGNNAIIDQFIDKVVDVDFIKTEDEKQALLLEDQLIKKYQPKFNIQQKDDKSYFWVSFSNDEWSRVQIIHRLKTKNYELQIAPVGPFVNGTELKKVLRALRKILPYRTCKNSYEKPCLQWHLGLCPAHRSLAAPFRSLAQRMGEGGPAHSSLRLLPEQAQRARRRLNADPSTSSHYAGLRSGNIKGYLDSLNTLRQLLRLYAGEPIRIEAYDISNIQGTSATGSMIVFAGNKPKKSDYRKFKIKTVRGANDVAMIKEVLRRRLNHKEWPLPDLILIDGGRAQLNSAFLEIRNSKLDIPLISLAKRDEELYTIYSNKILRLSALPISLRLTFQAIRNEAHRFAISYYRRLHRKNIRK